MKALLVLLSCMLSHAVFSQTPAPVPTKSIQQKQADSPKVEKVSEPYKRGTPEAPVFVEIRPSQKSDEIAKQQAEHEHEKSSYDRLIAWSTVVLAGVTALLAWFTARLWLATKKLVEDAKETSQRQLRAYVNVTEAWATKRNEMRFPDVLRATVQIKNSGQTPAYNVRQWIAIVGKEHGELLDTSVANPPDGAVGVMAPGGKSIFHIPTKGPLTSANYAELESGETTIYVFGEINYVDAFGINRVTKFRLMLSKDEISLGAFSHCGEGNEAT